MNKSLDIYINLYLRKVLRIKFYAKDYGKYQKYLSFRLTYMLFDIFILNVMDLSNFPRIHISYSNLTKII